MPTSLIELLAARRGHFKLESGYHGDVWMDLEPLFQQPGRLQPFTADLSARLGRHGLEAVCGPLVGGAFLAQLIALELGLEFFYTERLPPLRPDALFGVRYRIPEAMREPMRGMRVAIVDDAINAGSAVLGTRADLLDCGALPAAMGALLVVGSAAARFSADLGLPLESVAQLDSGLWPPADCPLCASGAPLQDVAPPIA